MLLKKNNAVELYIVDENCRRKVGRKVCLKITKMKDIFEELKSKII